MNIPAAADDACCPPPCIAKVAAHKGCYVLRRFFDGTTGALAKLQAAGKAWQSAYEEAASVYGVDIQQREVIEAIGAAVVAAAQGVHGLTNAKYIHRAALQV
jgi:hypothetical protein